MIGSGEYGVTTAYSGFLVKTDKNGDLIWQRVYEGEPTIPNYFYGFNTTSDGGFIVTGQYNHIGEPYQNLWLVKTDSLGCDSVSCSFLTSINEINKEGLLDVIIYPNPNNGTFYLEVSNLGSDNHPVTVTITNLLGQVQLQKIVNVSNNSPIEIKDNSFTKGIYLVRLSQNNKVIGHRKLIIE